jgi:hypothetical protein
MLGWGRQDSHNPALRAPPSLTFCPDKNPS